MRRVLVVVVFVVVLRPNAASRQHLYGNSRRSSGTYGKHRYRFRHGDSEYCTDDDYRGRKLDRLGRRTGDREPYPLLRASRLQCSSTVPLHWRAERDVGLYSRADICDYACAGSPTASRYDVFQRPRCRVSGRGDSRPDTTRGHTGTCKLGTSGAWGVADSGLRAKDAQSTRGLGFSSPSNCTFRPSISWCDCHHIEIRLGGDDFARVHPAYAIPCSTSQRFFSSCPARLLRPLLPT